MVKYTGIGLYLTNPALGREIPAEVAARTDEQNNFPPEMWKKLGDAGYENHTK